MSQRYAMSQQYSRSSLYGICSRRNGRAAAGMRARGTARWRINERATVHQEQQKEVFDISFAVFTTVYVIILAFIQASLEFVRTMATGPAKGIPGMLGPYYEDGGNESKQPIDLRSFPDSGDARPASTPVTSRTDDPQQTEDKNYEDHLPISEETLSPLLHNKPPTEPDKVYVMAQPMPTLGTLGTPYFTGQNVLQFIEQYERLCIQHYITDDEKHQGLPEYCDYWIGTWI